MVGREDFPGFAIVFIFFALYIGSSTLVRKTNMAFAKQRIMKT